MPPRHPAPHSGSPELNPEEIRVTGHRVACDGGGGALGHPLVYLELGAEGVAECGYCDRRFVHASARRATAYADPSPRHEAH